MITFAQTLIDGLSLGSLYALVALGIGLLFGILRLINLAHGDFITIGAYALIVPSADITTRMLLGNLDPWLLVPSIALIVVIVALMVDALTFRALRAVPPSTLMIASFAVSYVLQNGLIVFYGARAKAVNLWPELGASLTLGALRLPVMQIVTIATTLVLMAALGAFLKHTAYGVQMRAAAEDAKMARYLGIRANRLIGMAFAISGILAAVVSLLFLSQTGGLAPTMGMPLALFGFVAVVIGGMGSLVGAALGGLSIGMVVIFLQAYLPADLRAFRDAFAFAFVILVLLVRPAGLVRVQANQQRV